MSGIVKIAKNPKRISFVIIFFKTLCFLGSLDLKFFCDKEAFSKRESLALRLIFLSGVSPSIKSVSASLMSKSRFRPESRGLIPSPIM